MKRRENGRWQWTGYIPGLRCCFRAANVAATAGQKITREDGSTLVETALSSVVLFAALFGILDVSYILYSYNFVSDAAREATRYAIIRGPNSCADANITPFPDCGLSPTKFTSTTDRTQNPLLNYVESQGYPGFKASNLSMKVTYLVATKTAAGLTTWATDSSCSSTSDLDSNGNACNNLGNMINVQVTYSYSLNIPFWAHATVPVSSTSQVMISE